MVDLAVLFCSDGFIVYKPAAENKQERYTIHETRDYTTLNWQLESMEDAIATMEKLFFQKS